ncbi:hypothetical protein ACFSL6_18060 [Paenibacillus thailandensis]|uniref:DUF3188 domain-containing protein n=1 Tax=Paenibacillus thailandensis TaxID=393250 RepID=A0ABW5QST2_9BACL
MKIEHFMDLRVNIGLVLTIIGILLMIAGINPQELERLHGMNVNLVWGAVTTVVGLFFLFLFFRSKSGQSEEKQ